MTHAHCMPKMRRFRAVVSVYVLSTVVMLGSPGCGANDDRLAVYPVHGVVTFKEKPAEGVVLQLVPEAGTLAAQAGLKPGALTDKDGKYQVMTYAEGDGAPVGTYKVILFWPPDMNGDPMTELRESAGRRIAKPAAIIPGGPPDRFAGKYFDVTKTEWSVSVNESVAQVSSIDLND